MGGNLCIAIAMLSRLSMTQKSGKKIRMTSWPKKSRNMLMMILVSVLNSAKRRHRMPKEVYISSSSPFSVVTYHGESTIGIYNSEPDGDEYGWPQDFYRDTDRKSTRLN